jgi:hypothetical protein
MRYAVAIPCWLASCGLALGMAACGATSNELGADAHADHHGPDASADVRREATSDVLADTMREAATDAAFVMAKHPPLPQVINTGAPGPGVLTAPQIVTVTFPGDPMVADLEKLGSGIASSAWWDEVRPGFCDHDGGPCIGDGPPGIAVELTTPPGPSYTDPQIQTWLTTQLNTGTLPLPLAGSLSQTIYVIYFPTTTVIHYGGPSCGALEGYHGAMSYSRLTDAGVLTQQVTYSVVVECPGYEADGAVTAAATLAFTTETASHEIMETTTDPVNGFSLDQYDPNTWGWTDDLGFEVGDLCDWFGPPPNYPYWPGENVPYPGGLTLQRIWSNPQAAAGLDPCLPIPPGVVFFEVAPQQQVFILDVGASVTFDAYAYSTAPTPDWTVIAQDFTPTKKVYLQLAISGATDTTNGPTLKVNNGDVLKVTMKLLADPGNTPNGEADGDFISYTGPADTPTAAYAWPFVVLTPADARGDGIDAAIGKRPAHKHTPGSIIPSGRSRAHASK